MAEIINQSTVTSKYTLPDFTSKTNSVTSNVVSTINMSDLFTKVRTSAKQYGIPGEEIEQTLTLANFSDYEISNVKIYDTITSSAYFKYGSMVIDDVEYPTYDASDYYLPKSILPGESIIIKYKIVLDDQPEASSFIVISNINYYVEGVKLSENSNRATINVYDCRLEIKKTSDYSAVKSGDLMTFQNVITNTGNVKVTNLFFKDELPPKTTFIAGSVKINDVEQPTFDPTTGFALDDLDAAGEIIVAFKVQIQ